METWGTVAWNANPRLHIDNDLSHSHTNLEVPTVWGPGLILVFYKWGPQAQRGGCRGKGCWRRWGLVRWCYDKQDTSIVGIGHGKCLLWITGKCIGGRYSVADRGLAQVGGLKGNRLELRRFVTCPQSPRDFCQLGKVVLSFILTSAFCASWSTKGEK